jgi:hypothetical protein
MNFLKSLLKLLANTNLAISVRNAFGIKPIPTVYPKYGQPVSISDSYPWRTSNGFHTVFRFSDLPREYFNVFDSTAIVEIFDEKSCLLKRLILDDLSLSNELLVNQDLLDGHAGYGSFYVYHTSEKELNADFRIKHRSYVGFSLNNQLPSFFHGNIQSRYLDIRSGKIGKNLMQQSLRKQNYRIQNYFKDLDKVELFFINPLSKKISFTVNNLNFSLEGDASMIVDLSGQRDIQIASNIFIFRPIIFEYKNDFVNAYHA